MPRRVRKRGGTGIYHVMLRGINRQDVFEDDEDYQQMIGLMHTLTERRDENGLLLQPLCTLYAYCLISNHVHLLIRERTETISEVVKKLGIDMEERPSLSDSDIRAFLLSTHGIANPLMIQSLEKARRNIVLKSAKAFGAGIRQLSRLTGVSNGIIQKL